jgi:hypothetical protein
MLQTIMAQAHACQQIVDKLAILNQEAIPKVLPIAI